MPGIIIQPAVLGPKKERNSISISELYHENTKLQPDLPAEMLAPGAYTDSEVQAMARGYKQYRLAKQFPLPSIENLPKDERTFDDVINSRRSIREFGNEEISLIELSKIFHQSYGITGEINRQEGDTLHLRAVPSGGALYPAEIYLGIRKVTGLESGLYHYNVLEHALESLIPGDPTDQLYEICCQQEYTKEAAVVVVISGVLQRTKRKYGERGYRYVLLDVGHLGQNIYLSCTSLNLAIMTTCGFYDDLANKLLNIDGLSETTLYVAFLGKKK